MTIKFAQLELNSDGQEWLPDMGNQLAYADMWEREILSFVRQIMRDRNDIDIVPIVRSFQVMPINQYGHNVEIEVTYCKRGYRAIYAGYIGTAGLNDSGQWVGSPVQRFTCYMD